MRFFRDILLAALSAFLVLCLFELGLRITGTKYESSLYESDPVLYMTFRPNAHGWEAKEGENFIRINGYGMRDRERNLQSVPGTIRIALLGDSMMVGSEVPLGKTVGQVLEQQLNAALAGSGRSIEVLNFAVGGYTLGQEYLALRNRVWAFHPNIVLLELSPTSVPSCNKHLYPANVPYFSIKDGHVVPDPHNRPPAGSDVTARRRHAVLGDLMNEFRILQLIRKATQEGVPQEIRRLTGAKPRHNNNILEMWYHPPESDDQREAWHVAEGLLDAMAQDSRSHGAEMWITTVGHEIEETSDPEKRREFLAANHLSDFTYSESRLQSIAAAHAFGYISLEPELLEYSEEHHVSLRGFFNTAPDHGHWNEMGHRVAGSILADALRQGSVALTGRQRLPINASANAELAPQQKVAKIVPLRNAESEVNTGQSTLRTPAELRR